MNAGLAEAGSPAWRWRGGIHHPTGLSSGVWHRLRLPPLPKTSPQVFLQTRSTMSAQEAGPGGVGWGRERSRQTRGMRVQVFNVARAMGSPAALIADELH